MSFNGAVVSTPSMFHNNKIFLNNDINLASFHNNINDYTMTCDTCSTPPTMVLLQPALHHHQTRGTEWVLFKKYISRLTSNNDNNDLLTFKKEFYADN